MSALHLYLAGLIGLILALITLPACVLAIAWDLGAV